MGFAVLRVDADTPVVDAGIPIPRKRGTFRRIYPWAEMKVGDSFLVKKGQHTFGGAVWNAEQRYGIKLSTRSVVVGDAKCTRVWRTA